MVMKKSLKKIAKKSIFVVHAHGDNIEKLEFVKKFKNCVGTTQTNHLTKYKILEDLQMEIEEFF